MSVFVDKMPSHEQSDTTLYRRKVFNNKSLDLTEKIAMNVIESANGFRRPVVIPESKHSITGIYYGLRTSVSDRFTTHSVSYSLLTTVGFTFFSLRFCLNFSFAFLTFFTPKVYFHWKASVLNWNLLSFAKVLFLLLNWINLQKKLS